jgi:hypothetical protein
MGFHLNLVVSGPGDAGLKQAILAAGRAGRSSAFPPRTSSRATPTSPPRN